jgi:subtilisin-like proprotein convertase family protein
VAVGQSGKADFEATVVHELGHFLGLGHTYVGHELKNGDPADDGPIPTMYPTALDDDTQMRTPEIDDWAGLGALYGSSAFRQALGVVEGSAGWWDGLPILGGHAEIRHLTDPGLRVGAVTGYLQDGTGLFRMAGVPPGDYRAVLEPIPSTFSGASGIGPYEPPLRDVFATVDYRGPSETSAFTRVPVSAGISSTVSFSLDATPVPAGLVASRFSRLSPVYLADAQVTLDSVVVPRSLKVKDLSVFVDIAHQYIGDLKISLQSPAGTAVILVAYVGSSGNLLETTFTKAKVPGFSRFAEENAAGVWKLHVVDGEPEDTGTLRRWWITILSPSEAVPLRSDFDGNGKIDFGDFFLFADAFGTRSGQAGYESKYDLDGDGVVDFEDFFAFAADFGKSA